MMSLGISDTIILPSVSDAQKLIDIHNTSIILVNGEGMNSDNLRLLAEFIKTAINSIIIIFSEASSFDLSHFSIKNKVYDYIADPFLNNTLSDVIRSVSIEKDEHVYEEKQNNIKAHIALKEKAFRAILDGSIPSKESDITRALTGLRLTSILSSSYYIILHDLKYWDELLSSTGWNKIDVEFALKNILRELFESFNSDIPVILPVFQKCYLTLVASNDGEYTIDSILQKCKQFNSIFKKLTGYGVNSCISSISTLPELAAKASILLDIIQKEPSLEGAVLTERDYKPYEQQEINYNAFIDRCYESILKNNTIETAESIKILIDSVRSNSDYSFYHLQSVARNYSQSLTSLLSLKGIDSRVLNTDVNYRRLLNRSPWGIHSLQLYLEGASSLTFELLNRYSNEHSVISDIKKYIVQHISEDIGRSQLAEVFFLHEDYLSRLFKKEEGISLTQYITKSRVETAKNLLRIPSLSVTVVAEKAGFANFSYFSTIFKKETGQSPSEYKRLNQNFR